MQGDDRDDVAEETKQGAAVSGHVLRGLEEQPQAGLPGGGQRIRHPAIQQDDQAVQGRPQGYSGAGHSEWSGPDQGVHRQPDRHKREHDS